MAVNSSQPLAHSRAGLMQVLSAAETAMCLQREIAFQLDCFFAMADLRFSSRSRTTLDYKFVEHSHLWEKYGRNVGKAKIFPVDRCRTRDHSGQSSSTARTQAMRRAMPVTAGLLDVRGFGSEGDGRAINSTSIKAASLAAETSRDDTVVRLAGVIPATPSPTGAM